MLQARASGNKKPRLGRVKLFFITFRRRAKLLAQ
jgi:hypothetical protein